MRRMDPYRKLISFKKTAVFHGRTLFYYDSGETDKPVCLLVHGLADEADSWRHLFPLLSEKYRVIAPDLPGFGRSDLPKGICSVRKYSSVLTAWLTTLLQDEVGRAGRIQLELVVGNSMGAAIVQHIIAEHPRFTRFAVLLNGALVLPKQPLSASLLLWMIPGIGESLYRKLRKDPDGCYRTLLPYYADLSSLSKEDQEFLYARVNDRVWLPRQQKAYFSALRSMILAPPSVRTRKALSESRVPQLLLWGRRDHILNEANANAQRDMGYPIRIEYLENCGHLPQQEQPERVAALIADFQRSL